MKRNGPKGERGARGETGATGRPGRDGADGVVVTRVMGIRRWVRDAEDRYAIRAEMTDGSRSPKINLRAVLSDFLVEIDLPSMIDAAVAEQLRLNALKLW